MSTDLGGLVQTDDVSAVADSLLVDPEPTASPDSEQLPAETQSNEEVAPEDESTRQAGEESVSEEGEEPEAETASEDEQSEDESEEESPDTDGEDEKFLVPMPDGTEEEMTLEDIGKAMLRQDDYTRKTQEVAEGRRSLEREQTEFHEAVGQRLEAIDTLGNELAARLQAMRKTPEQWDELRETDFAEFDRQRTMEQQTAQLLQQIPQQREQELNRQRAAEAPQQKQKLIESLRADGYDLGDSETFAREYGALGEYVVKEFGVTPEQWNSTIDHVSIRIAYNAMKNKETQREGAALRKKVRKVPKPTLRPGSPRAPGADAEAKKKQHQAKLKKTGRFQDAVDLLMQ